MNGADSDHLFNLLSFALPFVQKRHSQAEQRIRWDLPGTPEDIGVGGFTSPFFFAPIVVIRAHLEFSFLTGRESVAKNRENGAEGEIT
ncbi:hypothetical protein WJ0W_005356 [Paenibacillus melissococcoides]|uniref:Uncharacterized protein n=1 Tax=Paenibacillus melissococcoides TaxID=2912268 RepID=A0ABM9G852_9BACL|nr:hypothetical protein WJ0W_005356 [Paenibacillus melissococcoides]